MLLVRGQLRSLFCNVAWAVLFMRAVMSDHFLRPSSLPPIPLQLPPPPLMHRQLPLGMHPLSPLLNPFTHLGPLPEMRFNIPSGSLKSATNLLPLLLPPPSGIPTALATDTSSIVRGFASHQGDISTEQNNSMSLRDMIGMESKRVNLLMNYLYAQQELLEAIVLQLEKICKAVNYSPSKDDLLYKLKNRIEMIPSAVDLLEEHKLLHNKHNRGISNNRNTSKDNSLAQKHSGTKGGDDEGSNSNNLDKSEEAFKNMSLRMSRLKKQIDRQKLTKQQMKNMSNREDF